ncbi:hypothetical protein Lsed01_00641 [Demequina sediminis]|uniref:NlpC/P60 domain-containing protein n=1 Tax=Demequina sediminis TaxID=1930058 RepID=A0ABP9WF71_9MICO|nr:C40 family peptidase [Demequina sediminis]BDZ62004.1 hypothetical protein GCM10025873_17950 [Demequina sediminis]
MILRRRVAALATIAVAASALVIAGPPHRATADNYPGQDQIDAARAAAASAAASVDTLDAAIVSLETARADAETAAALAADEYSLANAHREEAQATLHAAQSRAAEAEEALAAARAQLAVVAQAAYRDSGAMSSLGVVVGSETVEQVVVRSEAITRSSDEADLLIQEVKAAELVATTMRDHAARAAEDAEAAVAAAATALAEAEDLQRNADEAVAGAAAARASAIERLARMRGVSVALEEQRQEGLEADRREAEREAWEQAQQEAEQSGGSGGSGGSDGSGGSGGSDGGASTPKPTTTSTPKPTTTSTPKPTTTSSPKPTETPAPPVTGGWKSSAAQGQQAVDKALTLMGTDYLLGGNGPAYDCSGVTYAAWRSAGIMIPRSSQTQYNALTKVPISQMRPGDLVFYGSGRSTSAIYHVGIYIGGGMIAEATKPGDVAQIRAYDASWRVGNLIPYVGRP